MDLFLLGKTYNFRNGNGFFLKKYFLLFFSVLSVFIFFSSVPAQFIDYPHPELNWQSFDTEHFTIHFHNGVKNTALIVAKIAEEIYQPVTDLYHYKPTGKIHFIIRDTDDYSNGGAYFFDNKVEIWASNLDYIMRGTKNWLRDVTTHEFTHMISIQAMIKSNLTFPFGFFQVFGYEKERRKDVVRGFPNALVSYPISSINIPVWFAEGTAQHQASGSRYDYRDPHREMILRDRILHNHLLTYNEMTVFGKDSHGNESAYNLGFSFVNYLVSRFGEDVLARMAEASSRLTTFTFEGALEKSTGVNAVQLYNDWKDSLTTVYRQRTQHIRQEQVTGQLLETEGSANLYPIWSPDGCKIAYVSNMGEDYFSKNALILLDRASGEKKELVAGISSSLSWSPDGRYIAYSRQKRNGDGSAFNDLFVFDLYKEKEIRLSHNLRGANPDFSHDGKKLAFVSAANGLHQLNIYHLPDEVSASAFTEIFFDMENGHLLNDVDFDKNLPRPVKIAGTKLEQVLIFDNGRQIFHPRWSNDDSTIVFDTATDYGRDIGAYDLRKRSFQLLLCGKEEERYPFFQPNSPYLYYAASTTGIYNIYRIDLQDLWAKHCSRDSNAFSLISKQGFGSAADCLTVGAKHCSRDSNAFLSIGKHCFAPTSESELLTNVPGGAMMPAVNAEGQLVYACYDSVGYKIYQLDQPQPLSKSAAVYEEDYLSSIPQKNYDNTLDADPKLRAYRQTFTNVHILPRLLVDYGTVKPGLYLLSSDVLGKYDLIGGAAVNSDFDYDLYGYLEVKDYKPTFFVEVYSIAANIKNDTFEDTISIVPGQVTTLTEHQDVNFDLTELRAGVSHRFFHLLDFKAAFVWRNYNAKIDRKRLFNPYTNQEVFTSFTFHYNYLKGYALEWSLVADMIHPDRHSEINPSRGRYVYFRHGLEKSHLFSNFALSPIGLNEIYKNYTYNEFDLDWEEFFRNPWLKNHAFSLRLRAGYIDRPVDSFFNLFAGGLLGLKGYSFYSIEGRHKLIGSFTYRFPVWQNIDALLGHVYFDKLYFGMFYEHGNAWSQEARLPDFKRDVGLQLRLDAFSYSLFPTRFFAEAVYPLDEARNFDDAQNKIVKYPRDWRFYFGALYEFDLRERLGRMLHIPQQIFR